MGKTVWFVSLLSCSAFICKNSLISVGYASSFLGQAKFEMIGTEERPAKLFLSTSENAPLIVLLHGYTSNSQAVDTDYPFLRNQENFAYSLLMPNGTKDLVQSRFWNAIPACCGDALSKSRVDDVKYLKRLIEEARDRFGDRLSKRTVMAGHSNGAMMAYRFACEHPEIVTDVVSISGTLDPLEPFCKNRDKWKVNVLHIHSYNDAVIKYEGRDGLHTSALATSQKWSEKNGCTRLESKEKAFQLTRKTKGPDTEVVRWNKCSSGAQVELWNVEKSEHTPRFTEEGVPRILRILGIPETE